MGILGNKEIKYPENSSKQEKILMSTVHKSRNPMQLKKLKGIFKGFVGFIFFI